MADSEKISFDGRGVLEGTELFDADRAVRAAQEGFHVRFLFPWQRIVIANILEHKRQIVILPTGSGKSLCFLVPALLLDGATLVVYPLIALMNDQKRRMEKAGIRTVVFKGGQTKAQREENFNALTDKSNPARVIIANPEILQDAALLRQLAHVPIAHIAIDEAHCVSEWGDTFRPAYLGLQSVIKTLRVPLISAFTATASKDVLDRIAEVIFENDVTVVHGSSDRENIHYAVRFAYAKKKAALECALTLKKPLIIFCGTRRRAEETARLCAAYFGQEKTRFYHAGMTKEEKSAVEAWFYNSKDGIIAATCALGMGVDKADIATTVHLDCPPSLEAFAQESGRAGRNGEEAHSVLIWNHADYVRFRQAKEGSRFRAMGNFALSTTCRRQVLLDYLGEAQTACSGCDICDAQARKQQVLPYAADAEFAFTYIKKNRRLFTREEAVRELTEAYNRQKRNVFGINVWEAKDTAEILTQLLSERRLRICGTFWLGRIDIVPKRRQKTVLALIPRRHRHHLHRLRQRFRQGQKLLQRLVSCPSVLSAFFDSVRYRRTNP